MKQYALLFRMVITTKSAQPTKEQMKIYMQQWMDWINSIAEKNRLADGGNHFSRMGKVLKPKKKIVDKPYISDGVSVAGYIIIRAKDMDGATQIAEKCPILNGENTSVEIRELATAGS
jgi:hypothetical protein